ncbi:MAG: LacI family DNA-binding transcriptional regulator [Paracoccaceae bacterium]
MAREKITSLDVARLAGVSQSAVSRVFTGASASATTVDKVRRAAEELGYRPNPLARAMITGKSRIVGLIVAYLDNQFYPMALERLSKRFQEQGYHVLLFLIGNDTDRVETVVQELMDYHVDGILTASVALSNAVVARCEEAGIPVVMFNRGQDDPVLTEVTSDNLAGGRTVAQFLIAGGHQRIAHITGWQGSSTGRDRLRGFAEGMAAQGVTPFAIEDGMYSQDTAAEITRRLFAGPERPDALFVGNDHMAFAAMDVLRFELGLSVPEDVSVVGYDDVPIAAWPAYDLTTIRQPVNRMADVAVEAMLSRIEGDEHPHHIRIPGPLKIRGSARKPKGFTA